MLAGFRNVEFLVAVTTIIVIAKIRQPFAIRRNRRSGISPVALGDLHIFPGCHVDPKNLRLHSVGLPVLVVVAGVVDSTAIGRPAQYASMRKVISCQLNRTAPSASNHKYLRLACLEETLAV